MKPLVGLLVTLLALAATPAAGAPRDTLTVVTLNLWHDQHDWPRRLARILTELRARRPDVICLQEVLQHEKLRNQAETLADSLGTHWSFGSVDSVGRAKRYGNAILSRFPFAAEAEHFLRPFDDYRVAVHVRLDVRGRAVDVYDTHLHHTPEGGAIRAEQVADLLAWIDATRGEGPLVLAGDFNAELGTPELAPIERRFTDAFRRLHPGASPEEAMTLNPALGYQPVAIDHVLVESAPERLHPEHCEVLFRGAGPDSVWATDHFGVLARLRFANPARTKGRTRH